MRDVAKMRERMDEIIGIAVQFLKEEFPTDEEYLAEALEKYRAMAMSERHKRLLRRDKNARKVNEMAMLLQKR